MKLEPWVKKSLLVNVELSGKARKDIILRHICQSNTSTFGEVGSDKRKSVQAYWRDVKKISIEKYGTHLDKHRVLHGKSTLSLLRMSKGEELSVSSESSRSSESEFSIKESTVKKETPTIFTSNPQDLISEFKSMSMSGEDILFNTPPIKPSPLPFLTHSRVPTPSRTTPAYSPARSFASLTEHEMYREGTKNNPFVIKVDPNYPESHREFDVEKIDRMEHNTWVFQGYHIRVDVGLLDKRHWEAKMINSVEGYQNRSILVKGVSRKSFYGENESYHHQVGFCVHTKEQHQHTTAKIKADPDRFNQYWILLFPEELDNAILSGNNRLLLKYTTGVLEAKGAVTSRVPFVYWKIAVKSAENKQSINAAVDDDDFDMPALP